MKTSPCGAFWQSDRTPTSEWRAGSEAIRLKAEADVGCRFLVLGLATSNQQSATSN